MADDKTDAQAVEEYCLAQLQRTSGAEESCRHRIVQALEPPALNGLIPRHSVPDMRSVANLVRMRTLRLLYRKVQDGAFDPPPTDWPRSLQSVRQEVAQQLYMDVGHYTLTLPFEQALERTVQAAWGEFLADTGQLLDRLEQERS